MSLTAEQILGAKDQKVQAVDVPEWGGTVYVRTITAAEHEAWQLSCRNAKGDWSALGARAKFVALCACDENGKRLFTDAQAVELGQKHTVPVERVFQAAVTLNGVSREELEELEKNSESPQGGESSTD